MVKHKLDTTNPVQVYRAEVQGMGYHPNDNYCKKFVKELEYIKHISENQPITLVTYTCRFWSELDKAWVESSEIETVELKTYDKEKITWLLHEWNSKPESYVVKNITTINENSLDI